MMIFVLMGSAAGCAVFLTEAPDLSQVDIINNIEGDLIIQKLTSELWVYTAYTGEHSENGLVIIGEEGLSVMDPPETADLAKRLDALVGEYFGDTIGSVLWTKAIEKDNEVLSYYFSQETALTAPEPVVAFYGLDGVKPYETSGGPLEFGGLTWTVYSYSESEEMSEVHAALWLKTEKLLYAGVNVIALEFDTIESPVYETQVWHNVIRQLIMISQGANWVIPLTGSPGNEELLSHTQMLIMEREFTLSFGNARMPLGKWFEDSEIEAIFGKPLKTEESILGVGADTFTGSRVKTFSYHKTQIGLFAPPNGENFWLSSVTTQDPKFHTVRGISTGYTLKILTDKYPELKAVPDGRTDPVNRDYIYDDDTQGEYALVFEVRGGMITRLRLEYTMR